MSRKIDLIKDHLSEWLRDWYMPTQKGPAPIDDFTLADLTTVDVVNAQQYDMLILIVENTTGVGIKRPSYPPKMLFLIEEKRGEPITIEIRTLKYIISSSHHITFHRYSSADHDSSELNMMIDRVKTSLFQLMHFYYSQYLQYNHLDIYAFFRMYLVYDRKLKDGSSPPQQTTLFQSHYALCSNDQLHWNAINRLASIVESLVSTGPPA